VIDTRVIEMSLDAWRQDGFERFGDDEKEWRFVCPNCGHVASVQDFIDAGAKDVGSVGFACLGVFLDDCESLYVDPGDGPCVYDGSGFLTRNPIAVTSPDGSTKRLFAFADG